jgi:hypothetical protein
MSVAAGQGRHTRVEYAVDAVDTIVGVGAGWDAFGQANGLDRVWVGASLWDVVQGAEVRAVWRDLLECVRTARLPLSFLYRCDAPDVERTLRMDLEPLGGGVVFRSALLDELPRDRVSLLDADAPRAGEPVTVCGWCARVRRDEWVEADALGLEGDVSQPPLAHGICEACADEMRALSRSGRR